MKRGGGGTDQITRLEAALRRLSRSRKGRDKEEDNEARQGEDDEAHREAR